MRGKMAICTDNTRRGDRPRSPATHGLQYPTKYTNNPT